MKKKEWLCQIAYWLPAALLIGVLFLVVRGYVYAPKEQAPQVLILGDSILTEKGHRWRVTLPLEEGLGKGVFNATIGGSGACKTGLDMDVVCFGSMADGFLAGEFWQQKSTTLTYNGMEYVPDMIKSLETVDFDKVDTVLLKYGMNDYHSGVPTEEYIKSIDQGIATLKRRNPAVRVIVLTPSFSWYPDRGSTCAENDFGGGVLEAYVDALVAYGKEEVVEVIDQYHGTYDATTYDWADVTQDGLHPNEKGVEILIGQIITYLKE